MGGYAKYKKGPAAKLLVVATGSMLIIGGVFIALGIYADLGLAGAALILFVLIGRHSGIGWHMTAPLFNLK
jgi:uncharacterized membrane protein YphA (DoxX/SURF4 family)